MRLLMLQDTQKMPKNTERAMGDNRECAKGMPRDRNAGYADVRECLL